MGQITALGKFGKFNNGFLRLNAVEIIDIRSINNSREDQAMEDVSVSGDAVNAQFLPGRKAETFEVTFWESIYSGENEVTIRAAQDSPTEILLEFQLENAAAVPAIRNPVYKYMGFVSSYTPFDAEHDATLGGTFTFQITGALDRDITP